MNAVTDRDQEVTESVCKSLDLRKSMNHFLKRLRFVSLLQILVWN